MIYPFLKTDYDGDTNVESDTTPTHLTSTVYYFV